MPVFSKPLLTLPHVKQSPISSEIIREIEKTSSIAVARSARCNHCFNFWRSNILICKEVERHGMGNLVDRWYASHYSIIFSVLKLECDTFKHHIQTNNTFNECPECLHLIDEILGPIKKWGVHTSRRPLINVKRREMVVNSFLSSAIYNTELCHDSREDNYLFKILSHSIDYSHYSDMVNIFCPDKMLIDLSYQSPYVSITLQET